MKYIYAKIENGDNIFNIIPGFCLLDFFGAKPNDMIDTSKEELIELVSTCNAVKRNHLCAPNELPITKGYGYRQYNDKYYDAVSEIAENLSRFLPCIEGQVSITFITYNI